MLADDAQRIAAAIEEHLNAGAGAGTGQAVTATVKSESMSPKTVPAGAGRPTFVRYYIDIADATRKATLHLSQAAELLDQLTPDWEPDRLFAAIRALEVPVENVDQPAD
ncbi:MAG TPA: hypothetical protein VFQ77_22595 [Pseudonocardiaceae bacterium]|jgi:hypothetical protein|nr:hypothetical protein [Pseudonocardiaceae bacterium]